METQITLQEIKQLVIDANGGMIDLDELSFSDDLFTFGYDSISMVNLIELIENTYGIVLEPEKDISNLNSISSIQKFLIDQLS